MTASRLPYPLDPLADYHLVHGKWPKNPFGVIEIARRMPWLLAAFDKVVPEEYWTQEKDVAVVSCPCKANKPPLVPFNQAVDCEGDDCRRTYFFDGRTVRCHREPIYYGPENQT